MVNDMSYWHPVCDECVLDGKCLLQENGDVDECQDVQEYDLNELGEEKWKT